MARYGRDAGIREGRGANRVEAAEPDEMARMGDEQGLGVPAVRLEARRARALAPLLVAGEAVAALPASPAAMDHHGIASPEPHPAERPIRVRTDGVDPAGDLVAEGDRQLDARLRAVGDVEVGVAHPAAGDAHADLGAGRLGQGHLLQPQGLARGVKPDGPHRFCR